MKSLCSCRRVEVFALFLLWFVVLPLVHAGEAVRVWSYAALDQDVARCGIAIAPAEGGGSREIFFGASGLTLGENDFFMGLRYNGATDTYDHSFVSEPLDPRIEHLALGNVIGDDQADIDRGEVVAYDRASMVETPLFLTGHTSNHEAFALADVAGDDKDEVLILTRTRLVVHAADGAVLWELATPARNLTVGQMDDDPALEIALSTGEVIDSATQASQWTFPGGSTSVELVAVDVDEDGRAEIVRGGFAIDAFDVELEELAWTIDEEARKLAVGNIDDDPALEVVCEGSPLDRVYAYDVQTGEEQWMVDHRNSGVADIALGDTDGDGSVEEHVSWPSNSVTNQVHVVQGAKSLAWTVGLAVCSVA